MRFLSKSKIFFVSLALTYIVLVVVYYFTSVGIRPATLFLQMRRYLPCALAVAIAIAVSMWKHAGLKLNKLLPNALVGV